MSILAVIATASAQTGEQPHFVDLPTVQLYEKATHWYWGPNDPLTQLEYVVFAPTAGTPDNGHGIIIMDSGGFGSDDGNNLAVRIDTRNLARVFVHLPGSGDASRPRRFPDHPGGDRCGVAG